MNRRGDVNWVLISLVLGVIVLVILTLGLTGVWKNFASWFSPGNNVETIINQCQVACTTQNTYGYCTMERTLKAEDLPEVDGNKVKEISGTCDYFSTTDDLSKYNIAECPDLCTS